MSEGGAATVMAKGQQAEAEQLAQLLDGLLRDDAVPADLRALASLATAVREEIHVPTPDPAYRDALRRRIVDQPAAALRPVTEPPQVARPGALERIAASVSVGAARLRDSLRVAVATGMASMMIGSAGVAVASQEALPTDLLYPVKQATESVRLTLASSQESRGRLRLQFAEERLEEVNAGPDLPTDVLVSTLDAMDRDALRGSNDLLEVARTAEADDPAQAEELLAELRGFAERQRVGLDGVRNAAPVVIAPFLDRSMEVLRRIEVRVTESVGPCGACPDGAATTGSQAGPTAPSAILAPGDGPAVVPAQPCECPPPSQPAPDRLLPPVVDPAEPPGSEPQPDEPPPTPVAPTTPVPPRVPEVDERTLVPPLPDPLEPVGREIEQVIDDLLYGIGGLGATPTPEPEPAPEIDTGDIIDLGGLLDPLG